MIRVWNINIQEWQDNLLILKNSFDNADFVG